MTTATLHCHPATPCTAIDAIEVMVEQTSTGSLLLRYCIRGNRDALLIPSPLPAGPADNLWQRTCCEVFVAAVDGKRYREFNFSPSSQWAIYDFKDCRERDTAWIPPGTPQITMQALAEGFQLTAEIDTTLLPAGRTLQLGLSAVIEAADDGKSYWALAHCAAHPDFHRRDSFSLTLHRNTP